MDLQKRVSTNKKVQTSTKYTQNWNLKQREKKIKGILMVMAAETRITPILIKFLLIFMEQKWQSENDTNQNGKWYLTFAHQMHRFAALSERSKCKHEWEKKLRAVRRKIARKYFRPDLCIKWKCSAFSQLRVFLLSFFLSNSLNKIAKGWHQIN